MSTTKNILGVSKDGVLKLFAFRREDDTIDITLLEQLIYQARGKDKALMQYKHDLIKDCSCLTQSQDLKILYYQD